MENKKLKTQVINATKWSSITEIVAKLVSPITSMILARVLAPEAFGVIATITMIISFTEMFTDAGFQKYLIQHKFKDDLDKMKSANVAFLTNFGVSLFLLVIIIMFSEQIAILVGNPGLGIVIVVASIQLPITAFSSIQMALYRRDFDFKTLFIVRLVTIFIPLIITIPLAFLGFSYWSLVIGTIVSQATNALLLTIKSKWKPKRFYDIKILKEMLSFSVWSLIEAISIWLTVWVDAFIIGGILNEYFLGIYKTSTTMVNTLMALVTASVVPVMFSTLSRLQDNTKEFNRTFFKMQRIVSIFVFPLGVGVFLYRDLATKILLGSQWSDASDVIGIWALTSAIVIVLSHFCSEVYRAKGRPKLSFLAQILHLVVLVPTCIVSVKYGFWILVMARSLIRLQGTLVHFFLLKFGLGFPILRILTNVFSSAVAATLMGLLGYHLQAYGNGLLWSVLSIIFCIFFYFGFLFLFPKSRKEIYFITSKIFTNKK